MCLLSHRGFCLTLRKKQGLSRIWKYPYKDQTATYNSLLRDCFPQRYSYAPKWASSQCHHEKHSHLLLVTVPCSFSTHYSADPRVLWFANWATISEGVWPAANCCIYSSFAYEWLGNHMLSVVKVADQGKPFLQSELCHRHIKAIGWCRGNWMKPYSLCALPDVVLNEIMVPTDL